MNPPTLRWFQFLGDHLFPDTGKITALPASQLCAAAVALAAIAPDGPPASMSRAEATPSDVSDATTRASAADAPQVAREFQTRDPSERITVVAGAFTLLLAVMVDLGAPGRSLSLARTRLQEAFYWMIGACEEVVPDDPG